MHPENLHNPMASPGLNGPLTRANDPIERVLSILDWPRGLCKFYKVDSLTVATRILHNYQVLLDDGNRIILVIPQGNFKFPFVLDIAL